MQRGLFPTRSCIAQDKEAQLLLVLNNCIQNAVTNTIKSKAFEANKNATHSQVIFSLFFLSFGRKEILPSRRSLVFF